MKGKWPLRRLGEVVRVDTRTIEPKDHPDQAFMYVGLENIEPDTGRIVNLQPTLGAHIASTKYRFDRRHVLYGKLRPYLNKVCAPDFEGICATDIVPLLPSDEVSRDFLAYVLRSPSLVRRAKDAMTGTKMPRVRMKDLLSFEVPVPPLDEQRRIAARLDAALFLLEAARRRISESCNLTSALTPSLLRKAMPQPGEDLAEGEWVPLNLVSSLLSGVWGPEASVGSVGFPVVRSTEIRGLSIDPSGASVRQIPVEKVERYRLRSGDILINKSSGSAHLVGWPALFEDPQDGRPYLFSNFMIRLRFDERVNPRFALYYLHSPQARVLHLRAQTTTSGLRNLKTSEFASQPFPLLPREHQDSRIETINRVLAEVRAIEFMRVEVRERVEAARQATLALLESGSWT